MKKWTVTCYVQCFSSHVLSVHLIFHTSSMSFVKLSMALLIESSGRLQDVRQCSLA